MSSTVETSPQFTLDEYQRCLVLALECGYAFRRFEALDGERDAGGHEILLRHDIDYAPKYIPRMASVEAEAGIHATYCVQTNSSWYRIDSAENQRAIADALAAGHSLGLHIDVSEIASDEAAVASAAASARQLAESFGATVRVVSFHMPTRRPVAHLELPDGLINTYDPRFFTAIGYVSDSNHNWHGIDLAQLLRSRRHRRLQLLIHPFWWRERPQGMRSKLHELANELAVNVDEIVTPEQWEIMARLESTPATVPNR